MYLKNWRRVISKTFNHVLFSDNDEEVFMLLKEALTDVDASMQDFYLRDVEDILPFLQKTTPQFIFLDINMPRKDDFSCQQELKSSSFSELPVILLTSTRIPLHVAHAYQSGTSLFFTKPPITMR